MSRLIDNLNRLSETKKVTESILVKDAEVKIPAPVVREHKRVDLSAVFIIFLIAFSALAMAFSFKTLSQLEQLKADADASSAQILSRLKQEETDSATLMKALSEQNSEMQALKDSVADQHAEELAKIAALKEQATGLQAAIRDKEDDLEKMIDDLKKSDQLIREKQDLLSEQVKKITEVNSYLYNTY